jgi:hypothetical protein
LKHVILGELGITFSCVLCQLKICQVVHEERQERLQTKPPKSHFLNIFSSCVNADQKTCFLQSAWNHNRLHRQHESFALQPRSFQRRPPKIHHETETWHLFPTCQVSVSRL